MTTNTLQQSTESLAQSTQMARVTSIDILRALTMILMIFVNDLWSLKDIPAWLGHVERGVHVIKFYTDGQEFGVADLDTFTLTTEPP